MPIDSFQLQIMVTQTEALLTRIFQTCLSRIDADQGFLGFVDSQGNIKITVQKGEFWHLPADRGVTGLAFRTGETVIEEPGTGKGGGGFREASGEAVKSEIAVPVLLGDESAGVLVFDSHREARKFDDVDRDFLESQAAIISEALSDKDPWSFRSWWAKEQKKKRADLLEDTRAQLKGALREKFARYQDVDIWMAPVDEGGRPGRYQPLLVSEGSVSATRSDSDGDPAIEAILGGKPKLELDPIPRYRGFVPFPAVGPVVGIIRLESAHSDFLSKDTIAAVEHELKKVQTDPLALPLDMEVNDHYYLNFLHTSLTAHLHDTSLSVVLEKICDQASKLCGSDFSIYAVKEALSEILMQKRQSDLTVLNRADLFQDILKLSENDSTPARYANSEESIVCPVIDFQGEVVGATSVLRTGKALEDSFNSQVVEITSLLVSDVIENMRMRHSYDQLNKGLGIAGRRPYRGAELIKSEHHLLRSETESTDALDWLLEVKKIDLSEYRVFGNYVVEDRKVRDNLKLKVDELCKRAMTPSGSPYPVLLCASPGTGKTFFAREFCRELARRNKKKPPQELIKTDLAQSDNLKRTLSKHFLEILSASEPRIALLDEVDTIVEEGTAYRHLLSALTGEKVTLDNGVEIEVPYAVWFFTASKAKDEESYKKILEDDEKGRDFFRRFNQDASVIQLPTVSDPREFVCQAVAIALSFEPDLKEIQAIVLYYFAVSKWEDAGALTASVRTATQDANSGEILKVDVISNRQDFGQFLKTHHEAIEKLEDVVISISK